MTDRRRTKGEGTIRLRSDGRYEGREPPEIVPLGEKPRSFYGKSVQEVARKIRQARREREQGLNARSRQTVGAYLESWLAGPLKKSVARTMHQQYAALVHNYLAETEAATQTGAEPGSIRWRPRLLRLQQPGRSASDPKRRSERSQRSGCRRRRPSLRDFLV